MKIAFLTNAHPENRRAWSGLNYFMRRSLELAGLEVVPIGSLSFPLLLWPERIYRRVAERAFGARRLFWTHDLRVTRHRAHEVERRLKDTQVDAIFSPGSMVVSQLESKLPIYFWSDATFALMRDYYFPSKQLEPCTMSDAERLEYASLYKATHAFYASDWAADSAVRDYFVPREKVTVVPMGANLEVAPGRDEVERWIDARPARPVRFCLIGVEWLRKGCDYAVEVVKHLNEQGIESELTIAGCRVPKGVTLPPCVKTMGFVRNWTPEGKAVIRKLFADSHFLIVPSRAECFGLVFAEASAHGVPSLASDTGGIPSVVSNGVNGYRVALGENFVAEAARRVSELMADREKYRALALSSYQEFLTRLNWKTSGLKVRAIMEKSI